MGRDSVGPVHRAGEDPEVGVEATGVADDVTKRILGALEREPRVNLHRYPLKVEVGVDGVATLEGEAESVAAKKVALSLAAAIPGITGIIDRLHVAPAQHMTDGEIRDHVRDALIEEPAFDDYGITVASDGGRHLIRQPREGSYIDTEVRNGVVTLNGKVGSFSHKCLAGVVAWWIAGTRDVINGLEIVPPQEWSDADITEAVSIVLAKDPLINAGRIRVATENAAVTLAGFLAHASEGEMVELDAWRVFGVNEVRNRLETF